MSDGDALDDVRETGAARPSTPAPVKLVPAAPDPSVVEVLEEALERARAGEVIAVAIAEVMPAGYIRTTWSRGDVLWTLVGAAFHLAQELSVKHMGGQD